MSRNVLDYEPEIALFIPDHDPLRFYAAIAEAGHSLLKNGGKLYVEINACFGEETIKLLQDYGYADTELLGDLSGKPRFVIAVRK